MATGGIDRLCSLESEEREQIPALNLTDSDFGTLVLPDVTPRLVRPLPTSHYEALLEGEEEEEATRVMLVDLIRSMYESLGLPPPAIIDSSVDHDIVFNNPPRLVSRMYEIVSD